MINLPLLAVMTDESKKFLTFLAIILLAVVVIIGIIKSSIAKWAKKKAKGIDIYLFDMCKYQILESPRQVIAYTIKREIKWNYLQNRWFIRIACLISIAFVLIMKFKFNNDYGQVLEVLNKLKFEIRWPKAGDYGITVMGMKNFPVNWPSVTKKIEWTASFIGYLTYIEALAILVLLIRLIKTSIIFRYKFKRVNDNTTEYFHQGHID